MYTVCFTTYRFSIYFNEIASDIIRNQKVASVVQLKESSSLY